MTQFGRLILASVIGIPLGFGSFLLAERLAGGVDDDRRGPETVSRITSIGGPFRLTTHTGARVDETTYRGKVQLVFFGFTNCPDVCPTALNMLTELLDQLGPAASRFQPLFVTVDPERDTVDVLERYVTAFHPSVVGLTGTTAEIAAAAKAFRVYYKKVPSRSGLDYVMDHTATIYVLDRKGTFRATLDLHQAPDDALAVLRRFAAPGTS